MPYDVLEKMTEELKLTEKEVKLIKAIRALGYGPMKVQMELTVDVKAAEPVLMRGEQVTRL